MVIGLTLSLLVVVVASLAIYVNKGQPPNSEDVMSIAEDWTNPSTEVMLVKEINDDWVTFFRNEETLFVGKLEQNWLGQWRLDDGFGNEGPIGSEPINPDDGVVFNASGLSKGNETIKSYYFGMVRTAEVDEILLSTEQVESEKIALIEGDNMRFFFEEKEGSDTIPFKITALSDGKIFAES